MTHENKTMADNCCGTHTHIITKSSSGNCILPIPAFKQGEALTTGQWRCYNGGMYVACKDFDGALAYPDSQYFKGPHNLEDVLNAAMRPCGSSTMPLAVSVWSNCFADGCLPVFSKDGCAWDYDEESGDYRIYTSLKEDNHDKPSVGSKKNPATWEGGYTVCEYLNRGTTGGINGISVDNNAPALNLSHTTGAPIAVPLCDMDFMQPKILKTDKRINKLFHKTWTDGNFDFPLDNKKHEVYREKIPYSALQVAGIRPTDNAVIMRMGVSTAVTESDGGGTFKGEDVVFKAFVNSSGCDEAVIEKFQTNVKLMDNADADIDEKAKVLEFILPLNSDGSVDVYSQVVGYKLENMDFAGMSAAFRIQGFTRVAEGCYKAANPKCYGISGN